MFKFMFKNAAKTLPTGLGVFSCRRTFPRHLLHKLTTLAVLKLVVIFAQPLYTKTLKAESTPRPNIILIMADDMGYSDIQPYGGEIETPVLNRLASEGMRYTQFYNTSRCCPTRASLLTGLYPHQAGVGWMMTDRKHDGYRGDLNRQCVTIAEALKPAGYSTYMTGKWHITPDVNPDGEKLNWPMQRGFDRFYGTIHGAGSFFDPNSLTRDNTMISPFADPEYKPNTYYYTDAISDHAVKFIDQHYNHPRAEKIEPFFMYVAYTAAHWPMHALPEDIKKYKGKYDDGYAPVRAARLKRLHELGLTDPSWQLTQQSDQWENVQHKEWEAACMEVYAAMIDRMDQGIGKIVSKLEEQHQLENTLIFFLQDNGGCAEGLGRNAQDGMILRADGPTLPLMRAEELQTSMIPKQSRDGYPVLQGPGVLPGPADTYIAYGRGWANASNTPFREYKHWVHEGGISTPLIAHWPNGIPRKGELEAQPGHLIDIMATCIDVSKANYPREFNGKNIKPLEGKSLVPSFHGKVLGREALYWEHEGNRAIREGDWKLVAKENKPWELYNMQADRTETKDLAKEMPDKVQDLADKWDAYASRADVLPLNGWRENKKNLSGNQKHFELSADAKLDRAESPNIANKPFNIEVTLKEFGTDGVLVAQGGTAFGYALYLHSGQVHFAIRNRSELNTVSADHNLKSASSIKVVVKKNGQVTLTMDGNEIGTGVVPSLVTEMPADGLEVGQDLVGLVGHYQTKNQYSGKIESVVIDLHSEKK